MVPSPDPSPSFGPLARASLVTVLMLVSCGGRARGQTGDADEVPGPSPVSADGGQPGHIANPEAAAGGESAAGEPSVTPELEPITDLDAQEQEYLEFLGELNQARYERTAECFGAAAPDYLVASDPERLLAEVYGERHALRLGTKAFDAAKAAECLQAISDTSCQELALYGAFSPEGVCSVLVGQVPPGGACLGDGDCQEPEKSVCRVSDQGGARCAQHCTAREATAPPGALDEPCRFGNCLPGLYCRFTEKTDVAGFCRPRAPGGECEGVWQCPYPYACDLSSGGSTGTCAIGRGAGESCQLGEDYNGRNSNCTPTLSCYADADQEPTCQPGRELGETCGTDAATGTFIKCHVGYCGNAEPPKASTCVARKGVGEPCSGPVECRSLLCQSGICGPIERRIGSPCEYEGDCGVQSFCSVDVTNVGPSDLPGPGTCQAFRRIGETCSESQPCEQLSDCIDHVCQRCPASVPSP